PAPRLPAGTHRVLDPQGHRGHLADHQPQPHQGHGGMRSDRRRRIIYAARRGARIIYIGQTGNFRKRVSEHKVSSHWAVDGVFFVALEETWGSDEANALERELIEKHRPEFNIQLNATT